MRAHVLLMLLVISSLGYSQNVTPLFFTYQSKNNPDVVSRIENMGLKGAHYMQVNRVALQQIVNGPSEVLSLTVPVSEKTILTVDLQRREIFSPGFKVIARGERGDRIDQSFNGVHYTGRIAGEDQSLVAISFFEDKLAGVISYRDQNYNIELLDNKVGNPYVTYRSRDLNDNLSFECHTADQNVEEQDDYTASGTGRSAAGTIDVYIECDYQMFQHKGSVSNTSNYATGLFNVVAGIFADAGGPGNGPTLQISEMIVWTTPDPYGATVSGNSSSTVLNNFKCEARSYNGRLAHLLSTSSRNLGGIAQLPYCSSTYTSTIHGFSNIHQNYNSNLNNYSWSVNVLAHELGHNMSSPHTHSCSWDVNGNGQLVQIDDCGNIYLDNQGSTPGSCYEENDPIIPPKGTVMSYCHLNTGNGIDLSEGFHPLVAQRIIDFSNCVASEHRNSCAGPNSTHLSVTNLTNTSSRFNCSLVDNMETYYWRYKPDGGSWEYTSTSTNYLVVEDLIPDTEYEYKVLTYCTDGNTSGYSCSMFFTSGVNCPETVTVSGDPIDEGTYQASNQVLVEGMVESGTEITVQCNNEIEIMSDFQVQINAVFTAMISDGCN